MNQNIRRTLHRIENHGHGRFLTFSCYRRLPLFSNDRIKDAFVERLAILKLELDFKLFAWVIMPEHVHLLVQTSSTNLTVTQILRRLKIRFAKLVIERWQKLDAKVLARVTDSKGKPHFWQTGGGYDHNLFTEVEWMEKIEYIHLNPVRRGLVEIPTQWQWSSARWYDGSRASQPVIDPLW